jgi:FtsP/CotA-like multicopper oxidase with cupredoxin domain
MSLSGLVSAWHLHNRRQVIMTITRRSFLKYGAGASAALALPWTVRRAFAARPAHSVLTKYIQPLPVPGNGIVVATPSGMNQYAFTQRPIARQLHPNLPLTPFWAYDDGSGLAGQAGSFGMAIVAQRGTPLDISYTNELPETYPDWIPVDTP